MASDIVTKLWHGRFIGTQLQELVESTSTRPLRILISGPPGCGKTTAMKMLCDTIENDDFFSLFFYPFRSLSVQGSNTLSSGTLGPCPSHVTTKLSSLCRDARDESIGWPKAICMSPGTVHKFLNVQLPPLSLVVFDEFHSTCTQLMSGIMDGTNRDVNMMTAICKQCPLIVAMDANCDGAVVDIFRSMTETPESHYILLKPSGHMPSSAPVIIRRGRRIEPRGAPVERYNRVIHLYDEEDELTQLIMTSLDERLWISCCKKEYALMIRDKIHAQRPEVAISLCIGGNTDVASFDMASLQSYDIVITTFVLGVGMDYKPDYRPFDLMFFSGAVNGPAVDYWMQMIERVRGHLVIHANVPCVDESEALAIDYNQMVTDRYAFIRNMPVVFEDGMLQYQNSPWHEFAKERIRMEKLTQMRPLHTFKELLTINHYTIHDHTLGKEDRQKSQDDLKRSREEMEASAQKFHQELVVKDKTAWETGLVDFGTPAHQMAKVAPLSALAKKLNIDPFTWEHTYSYEFWKVHGASQPRLDQVALYYLAREMDPLHRFLATEPRNMEAVLNHYDLAKIFRCSPDHDLFVGRMDAPLQIAQRMVELYWQNPGTVSAVEVVALVHGTRELEPQLEVCRNYKEIRYQHLPSFPDNSGRRISYKKNIKFWNQLSYAFLNLELEWPDKRPKRGWKEAVGVPNQKLIDIQNDIVKYYLSQ